jgi:hypothetical protein
VVEGLARVRWGFLSSTVERGKLHAQEPGTITLCPIWKWAKLGLAAG